MVKIMMSSFRVGESLSERLGTLRSFYSHEQHIWDIGCDHGLLGSSFHDLDSVKSINLIDPSLPVINNLKDSYISKEKINIKQARGQEIKINENSNCIFIAGMGGKEIGEIVKNLLPQIDSTSKFVISPHRKILELRKLLHEMDIALLEERLLLEGDQYYQIMSFTKGSGAKVSLYGEGIFEGDLGRKYREHQIKAFGPHQDSASKNYLNYLKAMN
jgi:tRNA (adenine22-N1)-methyltransferase